MIPSAYKEMTNPEKPLHPLLKLHVYDWLTKLRESGEVNMFFIRQDLEDEWSLTKKQSVEILKLFHNGELEKHHKDFHKGHSSRLGEK